jgi:DNA modification methylase
MKNAEEIKKYFEKLQIDKTWSFDNLTTRNTSYISHGYYTYPAKFIPQLAERLIKQYSNEDETVLDPFAGSFTTLVESLKLNRKGIGNDINEISFLLGKVKTKVINPSELELQIEDFKKELDKNYLMSKYIVVKNERINFWYDDDQKKILGVLLKTIKEVPNKDFKEFLLICFSQILKTCSIWMQKSVKPLRDYKKKKYDPISTFFKHLSKMTRLNQDFFEILSENNITIVNERIKTYNQDSRNLSIDDNSVDLIITSPPYVTSYEYADLHQLPLLWLEHMHDLKTHRRKFIGSSQRTSDEEKNMMSSIADDIILKLGKNKKSSEVKKYFQDMLDVFIKMYQVLKDGGKFCIVIGNTEYKGVPILNAEVYLEQLQNIGFSLVTTIKREIPSKMLPSTRDNNGKFTKASNIDKKLVYPTEYIIVVKK